MGEILNVTNLNKYIGRYSNRKAIEDRTDWYIYDLIYTKIPILALRNQYDDEKNWPMVWGKDKFLAHAIELTLNTVKSWQAFRPNDSQSLIRKLKIGLPPIILNFQNKMLQFEIWRIRDLRNKRKEDQNHILMEMSEAVGKVACYKNENNPMMGSKILHFLFPEFFSVWDTYWIKNKCLKHEKIEIPDKFKKQLSHHNRAAREYFSYLHLMSKDKAP